MECLNFGCANVQPEGWVNLDRLDYGQDALWDLRQGTTEGTGPLDFPTNIFDVIVAAGSLQCAAEPELDFVISELARVLKPGGLIRIIVPDIDAAIEARTAGDRDWPGFIHQGPGHAHGWTLDRLFCHYLTQGGTNRVTFTFETLRDRLAEHRLHVVTGQAFAPALVAKALELDARLDESIAILATK